MARSRTTPAGVALVVTALLTACGTTVPQASRSTTADGFVAGSQGSTPGGQQTVPGSGPGAAGGVAARTSTTTPGVAATPSTTATTTGASTGQATSTVKAGAPITVGVVAIDYNELAAQFGVQLPSSYFTGFQNMFAYLDKHGGLAGHKVTGVYHAADGAAASYDSEAQTTCSSMTQDNHAQVVLSVGYFIPALTACLQQAHVAQIDLAQETLPAGQMRSFPGFFSPEAVTLEREAASVFDGMTHSGYVTGKSVVGVITEDCASYSTFNGTVLPALAKKYGFTVVQAQTSCYTGTTSLGQATSDIQSAVLKFRSSNVDRVFAPVFSEGFTVAQFAQAAENQRYYPGYVVTSEANLYPNSQGGNGTFPASALKNMHGVSWFSEADFGPHAVLSPTQKARRAVCRQMDPTLGGATSNTTSQRYLLEQFFYSGCDDLLMLGDVLAGNGGRLGLTDVQRGMEGLGSSYLAAGTHDGRVVLGPDRHDGAARMVTFAFQQSCSCFLPDGPPMDMPTS